MLFRSADLASPSHYILSTMSDFGNYGGGSMVRSKDLRKTPIDRLFSELGEKMNQPSVARLILTGFDPSDLKTNE